MPSRRIQAWAIAASALALFVVPARAPAAHADVDADANVRLYGEAGTTEAALGLGFGSGGYFSAMAGLRYFVVDGIAPGIEGSYQRWQGRGQGLLLGSLRFAPLRFASFVPVVTARGGRVFLSDHASGWAVGGDVGVLLLLSPHVALELGYGFLRLVPASFCADFTSCTITEPIIGVRITF